jgi:hypothetical protein
MLTKLRMIKPYDMYAYTFTETTSDPAAKPITPHKTI